MHLAHFKLESRLSESSESLINRCLWGFGRGDLFSSYFRALLLQFFCVLTLEFLAVRFSAYRRVTCLLKNPSKFQRYITQRNIATHGNRNSEVV